jgi:hypothetical protein
MRQIETEILISAPPQRVWEILTDVDSYHEWNPLIIEAAGKVKLSERLDIIIQLPGKNGMRFKPRIVLCDVPHRFSWLGRLVIPGFFDGLHSFALIPEGQGTRLTHSETLTGILVPFVWAGLEGPTREGFMRMNQATRTRCESGGKMPV